GWQLAGGEQRRGDHHGTLGDDAVVADFGDVCLRRMGGCFFCGGGGTRAGAEYLAGVDTGDADGDSDLRGGESGVLVCIGRWWAGKLSSRGGECDGVALWPTGRNCDQSAGGDFVP